MPDLLFCDRKFPNYFNYAAEGLPKRRHPTLKAKTLNLWCPGAIIGPCERQGARATNKDKPMEATNHKAYAGQLPRIQATDRFIGGRIRERRMMLGLMQLDLAELIGVTFQQMHKYETGTNRIMAGRLHEVAQALGVEVGYFYREMTATSAAVEQPAHQRLMLELARNFMGISKLEHQEASVISREP